MCIRAYHQIFACVVYFSLMRNDYEHWALKEI